MKVRFNSSCMGPILDLSSMALSESDEIIY